MRNKRFFRCRPLARLTVLLTALLGLLAGTSHTATAAEFDSGPWRIVNSATSGHLVPYGFGMNHQDNILIYAWNELSSGDSWRLEWVQSEYYIIRNTDTQKCLKPGSLYDGFKTFVTQATCSNSYEFQWDLVSRWNNPYEAQIVSRATKQALRPYYNLPNQVVILDTPSESALSYWSFNRL
ncbi:RICIN domain-containing protein [Streptomyces sp. NPDC016626]|uniref:RICIN domain-containing protein n=1 Tax=Streptomyces sp. NPDC016626 TaxID=3364968 RepID=UPI0036F80520